VALVATVAMMFVGVPRQAGPAKVAQDGEMPILAPIRGMAEQVHTVLKPPMEKDPPVEEDPAPPPAEPRVDPAPAKVVPEPAPAVKAKAEEKPAPAKAAPPPDPRPTERDFFAIVATSPSGRIHRASCPAVRQARAMAMNAVKYYQTFEEARRHSRTGERCRDCKP
jgi:hypothetical protein